MKNENISLGVIFFVISISSIILFLLISFFIKGITTGHIVDSQIHGNLISGEFGIDTKLTPPYSWQELIIMIPLGILILALVYSVIKRAHRREN
jgi:hypothetical protein